MNDSLETQLTRTSVRRSLESLERIERCVDLLTEEQVWLRPNDNTPSVGNLIAHLVGNITQWIVCSFTDVVDERERDLEFGPTPTASKGELVLLLRSTIEDSCKTISELSATDLTKVYTVQGFEESGTDILVHVIEHLSYHTGQIALHTKLLRNTDLGFYAGQDLNSTRPTDR